MTQPRLTQQHRFLTIQTPLGEDALILQSLRGTEGLSQSFAFDLVTVSENISIATKSLLGQAVSIQIASLQANHSDGVASSEHSTRYLHGIVDRFVAGAIDSHGRRSYPLRVVPWMETLKLSSNCQIFQDQSIPDIVMSVIKSSGFSQIDSSHLTQTYPKKPSIVQYNESNFDFVHRLLADAGIFYDYIHEANRHILRFWDQRPNLTRKAPVLLRHQSPGKPYIEHFTRRTSLKAIAINSEPYLRWCLINPSQRFKNRK